MANATSPINSPINETFNLMTIDRKSLVVKSGVVYYKPSKILSLQSPRKYTCELYRECSHHPRQLELIDLQKPSEAETITLENVFKVLMNEGLIKGKFLFHVMTSKGKFTFGTDSSEETDDWVDTLKKELFGPPKDNVIYEYRVQVIKNKEKNIAYGDYLLRVYDADISIFTPNGVLPTKFRCPIKEIYRVKYHTDGPQEFYVTISVKNAKTNDKVTDILILSTTSAADVARVINYRKKSLASQDDKNAVTCDGTKLADEQRQKIRGSNPRFSEGDIKAAKATFNPLLKRQRQVAMFRPRCNTDMAGMAMSAAKKVAAKATQSLPRTCNMSDDPFSEEEDYVVSDPRAPSKRHEEMRKRQSLTDFHTNLSRRPPAALLSNNSTSRNNAAMTYAGLKSEETDEETYVIDSIGPDQTNSQYLHVLTVEEEDIFVFIPDIDEGKS